MELKADSRESKDSCYGEYLKANAAESSSSNPPAPRSTARESPPEIKTQPSDRYRPRQDSNLRPTFSGGAVPAAPTPGKAMMGFLRHSDSEKSLYYEKANVRKL
eukprot:1182057-Prorocentrum_minimum.AAC.4